MSAARDAQRVRAQETKRKQLRTFAPPLDFFNASAPALANATAAAGGAAETSEERNFSGADRAGPAEDQPAANGSDTGNATAEASASSESSESGGQDEPPAADAESAAADAAPAAGRRVAVSGRDMGDGWALQPFAGTAAEHAVVWRRVKRPVLPPVPALRWSAGAPQNYSAGGTFRHFDGSLMRVLNVTQRGRLAGGGLAAVELPSLGGGWQLQDAGLLHGGTPEPDSVGPPVPEEGGGR